MAKPKSKTELLHLSSKNYRKLNDYVSGMNVEDQNKEFPTGTLNRNIRDVLGHLHAWHLMMLEWYKVGVSGQKPAMPAEGYTWKMTSKLNSALREQYSGTSLEEVKVLLDESYQKVQQLIENHTDEELFEKKRYQWTGSTSLGAYLISATSSHYDWALKLIKKGKK